MDRAALDHIQQEFEREVRKRFPDAPIQGVAVLQYGDSPEIEPGELMARVYIEAPEGEDERKQAFEEFHNAHRAAIRELRRDLDRIPEAGILEFVAGGPGGDGKRRGPIMRLGRRDGIAGGDSPLTPVMARLGPDDLETVDALITAGFAANRAEAVRWALARIRERPAYEKLIERTRELQDLKSQF